MAKAQHSMPARQMGERGSWDGIQLIQAEATALPGFIDAGDLLRVDFDQRSFRKDGYYLVGLGKWRGVRRLDDTLQGVRFEECDGERLPLPDDVEIFGFVDMIYKGRPVGRGEMNHG